jgi:predicted enzyme related to lactoylglutathione lyase
MDRPAGSYIQPFVPAKDFAVAKAFYLALGFTIRHEDDGVIGFIHPDGGFLLQNYWQRDWAENFMFAWAVDDLEAWYEGAKDKIEALGGKGPTQPEPKPWGMTLSDFIDPSGVCWHVSGKK